MTRANRLMAKNHQTGSRWAGKIMLDIYRFLGDGPC